MYRSRIVGTGAYLPPKKLTNFDIEKNVETTNEWILERTGIFQRSMAADGVGTSDLAYEAAKQALEDAKMEPDDLDMIIFCTITPDFPMPTSACYLQSKLGARDVMAFDLGAACSGWVYGMTVADQFIRGGVHKNVLVVGAEILHHKVDYTDRGTCILFGDGAGATIVSRTDADDKHIIHSGHNHADGSHSQLLYVESGGSVNPFNQAALDSGSFNVTMNGREIFKQAVRAMSRCCQEALDHNGISKDEVDWVIPHQANIRIMEAVAKHFDISMDKMLVNIKDMGNTSAATIPVSLDAGIRDGRIKKGDLLLFTAFGAGLTSGSLLVRY